MTLNVNMILITAFVVIAALQLNTAQARPELQSQPHIMEPIATPETFFVDVEADEIDLDVFNATYILCKSYQLVFFFFSIKVYALY